ncbi:hypothetical protein J6590_031843 [Homalodisca vitripennis]|nr:hypothetical protein J6590_031843 [Homalodisca vitripennis]
MCISAQFQFNFLLTLSQTSLLETGCSVRSSVDFPAKMKTLETKRNSEHKSYRLTHDCKSKCNYYNCLFDTLVQHKSYRLTHDCKSKCNYYNCLFDTLVQHKSYRLTHLQLFISLLPATVVKC